MSSLNLQEIDQEQALNLSKFFLRSHQNIFLFGKKGVGKTHIAIQAAQECGYNVNYINLSVIERSDLAGYPDMASEGSVVTFKSPYFLPKLNNEKADSILLFDEVDKVSPEVTAPLLEILQFKKINGQPINVIGCVLTGNLPKERAYTNLISAPLLDRGAKFILTFNFDKWVDWAKINNVHDLIIGFLRSNPEFASSEDDSKYASPSPRGWTLASDALIRARDFKIVDIETTTQIISGFVGCEAGLRFKIWYEYYRKLEPFAHSLIENGEISLNFHSLTPTEKLIFVLSACYYAKQKIIQDNKSKTKCKTLENLCNFLTNQKVEYEVQIMGFYNSFDFNIITKYKLYTCEIFFNHFKHLNENISIKR